MECGCLITDACDGEPAECFTSNIIAARKPHKCCECGETIQPGAKYEKTVGKWDGRWETYKTCHTCLAIRNEFCCSFVYTMLRQHIVDALGTDYLTGEDLG